MEQRINLNEVDANELSSDPQYPDWCLGQVIQALIDVHEEETASLLLGCNLRWYVSDDFRERRGLSVTLSGPSSIIQELIRNEDALTESKARRLLSEYTKLVLGPYISVSDWYFQVEAVTLPVNWRQELLEIVRKQGTTNQGRSYEASESSAVQYANLRFRSYSEVCIAKALDRAGVMYFANCTARVSCGQERLNREPDFLICDSGKWGILEVDGEPFHPPSRTVHDHDRDRLFERHGVRFVQHYDASQCRQEPNKVVSEFLDLLMRNG